MTTTEQLGVIGAQAARAEPAAPLPAANLERTNLLLEVLRLADAVGDTNAATIARATDYLKWIDTNG